MPLVFGIHEVEDGQHWANAWKKGPGSRHELFAKIGATVRTFRHPENPNLTGVLIDVPDIDQLQPLLDSEEGQRAMQEDRLKIETVRMLAEFTP
jgi:hypothetical protein